MRLHESPVEHFELDAYEQIGLNCPLIDSHLQRDINLKPET
jgi:hypothetical protein